MTQFTLFCLQVKLHLLHRTADYFVTYVLLKLRQALKFILHSYWYNDYILTIDVNTRPFSIAQLHVVFFFNTV